VLPLPREGREDPANGRGEEAGDEHGRRDENWIDVHFSIEFDLKAIQISEEKTVADHQVYRLVTPYAAAIPRCFSS
jgi:hypothetical protein